MKFLLVQNQGLNPGIQSRDPGNAFFNPEIPGLEKTSGIAIPNVFHMPPKAGRKNAKCPKFEQ